MKKNRGLAALVAVLSVAAVAAAVMNFMGLGRHYIDKENKITAAVADIENIFSVTDSKAVFSVKLREITDYFAANGINTAIIPFNKSLDATGDITGFIYQYSDAEFTDGKDVLSVVKKELENKKIQIIAEIDCAELTAEQLQSAISEINKKYAFAGVLLKNYSQDFSFLQTLKMEINNSFHNYYFGIRLDSVETARQVQKLGAVDFYIFDSITESEYRQAKNSDFAKETVLLDYNSQNFVSELFLLANFGGYDGAVLTEYTTPATDLSLYNNVIDTSASLRSFNFTVNNKFNVVYPSKDIDTYYETIYITGTADPAQPVYVNGNPIDTAQDGTFGYYMELQEGENFIEVCQADNFISRIVNKKSYSKTGQSTTKKNDDTKKAQSGQIIQTVEPLTSVLADPDSDGSIIGGLQQGVQLVVNKSVKTQRDGEYTWAYQLSNGGYVLAKNVEWADKEDYTPASINSYGDIEDHSQDGYYLITLGLSGKPGIVSDFDEDKIQITFLDTAITEDDRFVEEDGRYVFYSDRSEKVYFSAYQDGENSVITIPNTAEDGFWGYNVEYTDSAEEGAENNTVEIYIKKTPHKSAGAFPLKDITVVLDAGHGGYDPGALPLGGVDGPGEQDINLAIALAAKDCLEKLGATVQLTRTDDTYLTLQQRRDITNAVKPDLFISIHHNSLEYTVDGSQAYGVESYYFTPQSKAVAEIMADKISSVTERNNRGHYYGYYYVLRNSIAPCVLNEYGFIINPYEYSTLYSDESIYKAAMGTALAVLEAIPE